MIQVGALLADRYRVESRLAETTWIVSDESSHRPAVLKQLPADDEDQVRQWALRGGRTAARMEHPNIVAVHEMIKHGEVPLLVMEYFPARSLATVLAERGTLTVTEAAAIGAQAAAALAAAKDAGVVHGAVEPGNVLVGATGTAKLTDFGMPGDAAATSRPAYLAPEVARGHAPTAASDIFSLGATLHAALEGTPPFGNDTDDPLTTLHEVAGGVVPPAPHAGPAAPILTRMMHEDPAARPRPQQVRELLRALLDGQPVPTHFPAAEGVTETIPRVPPHTAESADPPPAELPEPATGRIRQFAWYVPLLLAGLIIAVVAFILLR